MKTIKALLLGAGGRGRFTFGDFAIKNPNILKIIAVAEPDPVRRSIFQAEHGIAAEYLFDSWEKAFEKLPPVDAVIITTQDNMHYAPLLKAMEKNLNVICEKPIVPTLEECRSIENASKKYSGIIMIPHVLKYTSFFSKIKELLDSGRIGKLIGIDMIENVGHIHISHSFVRGNWRKTPESPPMILAKSCHDMDMLAWLAGSPCHSLSSYGNLNYFKKENAPEGAPARCIQGCPHGASCPFNAEKIYLGEYTGWPVNAISSDLSFAGRIKALEEGPYGRCVFRCDNNVVDHQTTAMIFDNGVSASFTMTGFTMDIKRTITLFGTGGEINGCMEDSEILVKDFSSGNIDTIKIAKPTGGHGGGDSTFICDFAAMISGGAALGRNSLSNSFESHYMAFAAEKSRVQGGQRVILADMRLGK
ncbi:MAG: Gfo/Idh/MocA family oxidoreductase [Treponema sp.]|nr:Gfo/Idh/MocA family oxidoreductase [Treponema sp.]